jgi:5-methylthioribose kinase
VPEALHYDPRTHLLVTEFLAPHIVLRQGLLNGTHYPCLSDHLAEYLARSLFFTSDLASTAAHKRSLVAEFSGNTEMTQIMEDMIFTEIYHHHHRNSWTSPHLDSAVDSLRNDTALKIAVSRLKLRYLTSTEALLHGDLHTGSILVTADDTRVIDQEFAVHGPMGFDIGSLFAHLLLAYFALDGHETVDGFDQDRAETRRSLLSLIKDVWRGFMIRFAALWEEAGIGDAYPPALFGEGTARKETSDQTHADQAGALIREERERYLAAVFTDTIGFCGAEIIRRVIGMAHVGELQTIGDDDERAACELRCLRLAHGLLTRTGDYPTVRALTAAARAII